MMHILPIILILSLLFVIAICIFAYGYMGVCLYAINAHPYPVPFSIFERFCSKGKKAETEKYEEHFKWLTNCGYENSKYRDWFDRVWESGKMTERQYLAFMNQRHNEVRNEISRRKKRGEWPEED